MAADIGIPDKFLPAIRLAVFWIGLPFIGLLLGGEELETGAYVWATAWFVCAILSIAIAVYWDRVIGLIWPGHTRQQELQYLSYRDSDLGSAIISAARSSAYGRWYAAQILVNSGSPIQQRHLLHTMASQVLDKILDGNIEVRGRKPGQLAYEAIPRTYWRSTAFYVVEDLLTLWRIVLCPRGTIQIAPDGTIASASDAASLARTSQLTDYESLLVDAYQFEKVWPKADRSADRKRRQFLNEARERRLNSDEIQRLSDTSKWQGIGLPVMVATIGAVLAFAYVVGPVIYRRAIMFLPRQPETVTGFTQAQVDAKIVEATEALRFQLNGAIRGQEDLKRENERLRTLATGDAAFPVEQRQEFENALRYRNISQPSLRQTKIEVYAESANAVKAAAFADMLLAAQWHPASDAMGTYVLHPDFNIGSGITVIRPKKPDETALAGWQAIREALSQAHIGFVDGMPTEADSVIIAIGG